MFTDVFFMEYVEFAKSLSCNVDTSFRCRLQCPACARSTSADPAKRIKDGQDIKEEYFEMLLQTFTHMHLCGQISDPIYHPKFIKLLEMKYINYKHNSLSIHTNGSGKKNEWWDIVFNITDKKTRWVFALDGFTQDVSNIYRIGTDAENVKQVMVNASKKDLFVEWQYLVFEHNEHEVELAKKFSYENNITFALSRPDRFGKNKDVIKPSTKSEWVNKSGNLEKDAVKYSPGGWTNRQEGFYKK